VSLKIGFSPILERLQYPKMPIRFLNIVDSNLSEDFEGRGISRPTRKIMSEVLNLNILLVYIQLKTLKSCHMILNWKYG
jgi:hypothetical protein